MRCGYCGSDVCECAEEPVKLIEHKSIRVRRASPRSPVRLKYRDHKKLWRLVEGAVVDAVKQHPGYMTDDGLHSMVESVTKRVVGTVVSAMRR